MSVDLYSKKTGNRYLGYRGHTGLVARSHIARSPSSSRQKLEYEPRRRKANAYIVAEVDTSPIPASELDTAACLNAATAIESAEIAYSSLDIGIGGIVPRLILDWATENCASL
jgi:hypothetical protein